MLKRLAKMAILVLVLGGGVFPVFANASSWDNWNYYDNRCRDNGYYNDCWDDSFYTFRSTVTGGGIRRTGQYVYEITNQKDRFRTNERVFFLTRIFNMTNLKNFRFKHEIRGLSSYYYREIYSETYNPNRAWWAEIYYWKDLATFKEGKYEIRTLISKNGEAFKEERKTYFYVDNYDRYGRRFDQGYGKSQQPYCTNCDYKISSYNDYGYYRQTRTNYVYNWTKTGRNVRQTGDYTYEITNETNNFYYDQNVYVLTKLADIRGVDKFRIKHEVYRDGNSYYKSDETPELRPNNNPWEYNYTWANLGPLPGGNHQIRVSISVNGGSYKLLNTLQVNVARNYINNSNYNRSNYDYRYDWSQTDINIRNAGNYIYEMQNPKSDFYNDENVLVLTKISNIRNIDTFRIKHELYKGSNLYRTIESPAREPRNNDWDYNYTQSNFGRLSAGSYYIKVFISINSGGYVYLDQKSINVRDRYNSSYNYNNSDRFNYDWTITGTDSNRRYNNI